MFTLLFFLVWTGKSFQAITFSPRLKKPDLPLCGWRRSMGEVRKEGKAGFLTATYWWKKKIRNADCGFNVNQKTTNMVSWFIHGSHVHKSITSRMFKPFHPLICTLLFTSFDSWFWLEMLTCTWVTLCFHQLFRFPVNRIRFA